MKKAHYLSRGMASYILASLFLLYEMALQVAPSIMTEPLMRDLHIGAALLGVAIGVYFYSYAGMQIPAGFLYDRFGPRRLIACATLLCAAGAFIFGFAHDVITASFGRFCMGFGSAFAFVGALTVAARWFPHRFALYSGITQLLAAVGALAGAAPLAALVNLFGWRFMMLSIGCLGIVIGVACFLVVRDRPPHRQKKRIKHRDFMVKWREIFKKRQTWWIALYSFFSWGPVVVFAVLWGTPYLMERYGISNTKAASAVGMIWIGVAVTSPLIGYLSNVFARRKVFIIVCALIGLLASLCVLYIDDLPFSSMFFLLFAVGVGSSGQILCFALAKDIHPPTVISTAMGVNNMAVVAGGALLEPLTGFLINLGWDGKMVRGIPVYSLESYQLGLTILPLCFLCASFIALVLIQETYCGYRSNNY